MSNKGEEHKISLCIIDRSKIMYKLLSDENIKRGKSLNGF